MEILEKMGVMWLCPIKSKSYDIIKKNNIYGLPCGKKEYLYALEKGDLLAIYIHLPTQGIVSICKVISRPFVDDEPLWGINHLGGVKYRCRIKLKNIPKYTVSKDKAIPLHKILGFENHERGYIVEPMLRNVLFIKLSKRQSEILLNEMRARNL